LFGRQLRSPLCGFYARRLGTRDIARGLNLGFANEDDTKTSYERMKAKVNDELKSHFRPEFEP
jgi:ATP-dependent Clp protease ATP-binding subunit ClpA